MARRYRMDVYNLRETKLCTLYDSQYYAEGDAQNIGIMKDISGWKEISFDIPFVLNNGDHNFRADYLKAENYIYLYEDDAIDVYCIKNENDTHDPKKLSGNYKVNHISEELKTKNLYKYFDDENGIANCKTLIERAIAGTGWSLGYCATFYEKDGTTEKIRSYSCETKTGAYNMITGICALFEARPEFDGYNKTISIYPNTLTDGYTEMNFGKNMDKLVRKVDSSNLVTRLYVEGQYDEVGYVGIEEVNTECSGLPFIMDFSYFQELGLFTAADQAIVDQYIEDAGTAASLIKQRTDDLLEQYSTLEELIGDCKYVYAPIVNGQISTPVIASEDCTDEEKIFADGDKIAISTDTGSYYYDDYSSSSRYASTYKHAIKFIPAISGKMAVQEDMEKVKRDSVNDQFEKMNKYLKASGYPEVGYVAQLATIYGVQTVADLTTILDPSYDKTNLAEQYQIGTTMQYAADIGQTQTEWNEVISERNKMMKSLLNVNTTVGLFGQIDELISGLKILKDRQDEIEADFGNAMGSLLRDGYWSDSNYAPGQEDALYADALEVLAKLAKPIYEYSTDIRSLRTIPGHENEEFRLAQRVRIYDEALKVDGADVPLSVEVIITAITEKPEKPMNDTVEMKTDLKDIGGKTFSSVMGKVTGLADTLNNNKDVYKRAKGFTREGMLPSDLLEGTISTLKTRLLSTYSNWETDEKGNIMFTAQDGKSAMMLCGAGFMIASRESTDDEWNWRTFGTGEGFTADEIITGFLSADRIMAGSITTDKVSSNFGSELVLSSDTAVIATVQSDISMAMTSILSDEIINTVSDSDGYTEIRQTAKDVTIKVTGLSTRVDNAEDQLSEFTTWFTFGANGLEIGKTNSTYTTLTDNTGFHILNYGSPISSFSERTLKVEMVRVGSLDSNTRINSEHRGVIKEAPDGGLIITIEGL